MQFRDRIHKKLTTFFSPTFLEVRDDSAQHAGHTHRMVPIEARQGSEKHPKADSVGETHFEVTVVSLSFHGQTRLARHRMVYSALREELEERVHALSIRAHTPEEYQPEKNKQLP